MLEPVGQQLRLAHADGVELGIAVAVAQRERLTGYLGGGLAVPHNEDGRRARRRGEPVLADARCRALRMGRALVVGHLRRLERGPIAPATVPLVKLGYMIGYWGAGPPSGVPDALAEAERLGFDSCWTAEAYGSDALDTARLVGRGDRAHQARHVDLPDLGAHADRDGDGRARRSIISRVGGSCSGSARRGRRSWKVGTATTTRGRSRAPASTSRSSGSVLQRDAPVEFKGDRYQLPHPGGLGLGKPLKSIVHPLRADLPIFLAAEGPKNVALAAEIADGWLPMFYAPRDDGFYRDALAKGFARPDARRTPDEFEVACNVPIIIADDVEAAAHFYRPVLALYIGGMGARDVNFHNEVFVRMGYMDEAQHIQTLYLEGRKEEAAAAVPLQLVQDVALIGPKEKIRDDLEAWRESTVTTMIVSGPSAQLGSIAELVLG